MDWHVNDYIVDFHEILTLDMKHLFYCDGIFCMLTHHLEREFFLYKTSLMMAILADISLVFT